MRSSSPEESILQLLKIMASTSQRGWWRGSMKFGLRDTLAVMLSKHDARLDAIKQMNAAFEELGIDWVRVENIQFESSGVPDRLSYLLTLYYTGKGSDVQRLEI